MTIQSVYYYEIPLKCKKQAIYNMISIEIQHKHKQVVTSQFVHIFTVHKHYQ